MEYEQPDVSPDLVEALLEADRREDIISLLAQNILTRHEAERLAKTLEHPFVEPANRGLADILAEPDEEEQYSIDGLLPIGGNALFCGRFKAGKTTFISNLVRAWADQSLFLGRFQCRADPNRPVVTLFDYELNPPQLRRWMRHMNIRNQNLVHIVSLRGHVLPVFDRDARKWIVDTLRRNNTGLWIMDPASKAIIGSGDPMDNAEVAIFTSALDEIKAEAGVPNLLLTVHTPHGNAKEESTERAFGAQSWSAWADSLLYLTIDSDKYRFFRAEGRDVDVPKHMIRYDAQDKLITLVNTDPEQARAEQLDQTLIDIITDNPGLTSNMIIDAARLRTPRSRQVMLAALTALVENGKLSVVESARRAKLYYPPSGQQSLTEDDLDEPDGDQ